MTFFWFPFARNTFFYPLTLSLYVALIWSEPLAGSIYTGLGFISSLPNRNSTLRHWAQLLIYFAQKKNLKDVIFRMKIIGEWKNRWLSFDITPNCVLECVVGASSTSPFGFVSHLFVRLFSLTPPRNRHAGGRFSTASADSRRTRDLKQEATFWFTGKLKPLVGRQTLVSGDQEI